MARPNCRPSCRPGCSSSGTWPAQDARPSGREDEVYLSLPRPGGDAWLRLNLADGEIEYERTDRGWLSYFNDLHKGRHTGAGLELVHRHLCGGHPGVLRSPACSS